MVNFVFTYTLHSPVYLFGNLRDKKLKKEENDIEESTKSSYVHSNWFVSQFDFLLEINELSVVTPKSVAPNYQMRATSLSATEEQANN